MGKLGRRKQRQRRKQQQQQPHHLATTTGTISSSSAVHKLRHADPKIRLAALMTLQATAFHHDQQPYKQQQQQQRNSAVIALPVLQAVREQVMDSDLECAAVAAECLVLYLQTSDDDYNMDTTAKSTATVVSTRTSSKNTKQRQEATASWSTVLMGRLEQCCTSLLHLQQQQKQQTTEPTRNADSVTSKKHMKAWLAVTTPCINALCLLIETNGSALEQILLQRQTFCRVLFGLLDLMLLLIMDSNDSADMDTNIVTTTAMFAARTMHSALDENFELADTVMTGYLNNTTWKRWLDLDTLKNQSRMVQLHLLGCVVNLYLLVDDSCIERKSLEDWLIAYGISSSASPSKTKMDAVAVSPAPSLPVATEGLLMGTLKAVDFERLVSLESEYRAAHQLFESQQQDAQLEEEIIRKVSDRKESARDIARRQKKQQDEEEQERKRRMEEQGDVDMEDVEDSETKACSRGKFSKREQDGELAMDEVLSRWNQEIQPLQLTLEIFANLCTCWIPRDVDLIVDDRGEMPMTESPHSLQLDLQSQQAGLGLSRLVKHLCQCNETIHQDTPMWKDIDETIIKAGACLSNCVLSNVLVESDYASTWCLINDCLQCIANSRSSQNDSELSLEGMLNTMAILAQRQPRVVRMDDVELIYNILLAGFGPAAARSAICVLSGTIATSSLPRTEAMIRRMTHAFLDIINAHDTHHAVVLEILNAFMDWYGQDDFFPQVFKDMKVYKAMHGYLNKIRETSLGLTPEEDEILYNTEQFLEYKRTH
jgi:hypothetical protein